MKPSLNGGTTTRPPSILCKEVLERLYDKGPMPTSAVNPGIVDALTRREFAEIIDLPSPYQSHKGKPIPHLRAKPVRRVVRPRSEAPSEVRRAGGHAECACGLSYYRHDQYTFTDHPDAHDDSCALILVRDCHGNFWKL